ncbi:hypothetical protein D3C81_980190 [compost metagenome]
MAIAGDCRLMPVGPGRLQALLALVALGQGAVQFSGRWGNTDHAALPIEQQWRAGIEQQNRRTGADYSGDAKGAGDDGAMGRRAALSGDDTGNPARVQPGHIGRADLGHHQHIRLLRFNVRLHAAQLGQHAAADVAQVGGTFGEQSVVQRLLLPLCRLNHCHPRRRGAFALGQALLDIVGQRRVGEHFLVSDKDLANGLVAALHQGVQLAVHRCQGIAQLDPFLGEGFTAQGVIDGALDADVGRPMGDARRRANTLDPTARSGCLKHFQRRAGKRCRALRQRLDVLAQACFDGRQ